MVGTDEEKNTTMLISLSAASQYALFLLERTGARALRKSGQHLARTSYRGARGRHPRAVVLKGGSHATGGFVDF